MEVGPENSILNMQGSETESSWIPTTPAKPGLMEPLLICTEKQVKLPQANWINLQQIAPQTEVYQGNCSESGPGIDNWEAAVAAKSRFYRDGLSIYKKFSIENADNWSNVSFKNLLALADAAGTAATENGRVRTVFNAESRSSTSGFTSQMEYTHFQTISGNSPPATNGLSFESRLQTAPDTPSHGGIGIPSELSFDLNSQPIRITDAGSTAGISSQFAPITPDQTNRAKKDKGKGSNMPNLCTSETAKDIDGLSEVTITFELDEHQNRGQSELVEDQSCAIKFPMLWENHKPEKGSDQLSDLGKTSQQKPRRRKHRPKVVIESQPKRTPNPRTANPTVSEGVTKAKRKYVRKNRVSKPEDTPLEGRTDGTQMDAQPPVSVEMPKSKRKYVRRKGINQSETTPLEEGTNGATDSQATRVTRSRRSCRRSLNFESESQQAERSKHQPLSDVDSQAAERSTHQPSSGVDANSHAEISCAHGQSISTMNLGQGMNVMIEKTAAGIAYNIKQSMNHGLEGYLSTKTRARCPSTSFKTDQLQDKSIISHPNECTRGKCQIVFSDVTHDKEAINSDDHRPTRTPSSSNCSSSACMTQEKQTRGSKRLQFCTTEEPKSCSINATGSHYNSLQVYLDICPPNEYGKEGTPSMYFPAIYKKKRTEKVQNSAASSTLPTLTSENAFGSKFASVAPATNHDSNSNPTQLAAADCAQHERHNFEFLAMGKTERSTKKRSKGPTRVRDLASLLEICRQMPNSCTDRMVPRGVVQQGTISQGPQACMDALVADTHVTLTTKKRSKRNVVGASPAMMWKNGWSPIDAIVQQFNRLHINGESNKFVLQEQHALIAYHEGYAGQTALVVYQNNGTVIPFDDSFNHLRKRRPRAKVDLDDETNRVWKLLLEDINNEGIDGTDEQKVKWWEEQRKVFRGRADSFIARMRLVQGDRRFTPWKGSVVDSVVGVFLTQNVSDHLSSSAFMSMASRFPLKSSITPASTCEEGTSEGPEVLDPDVTIEWHKKVSDEKTSYQHSVTFQDMKYNEVEINNRNFFENTSGGIKSPGKSKSISSDSSDFGPDMYIAAEVNRLDTQANKALPSLEGYLREFDDVISSQNSAVSPQHSVDSIGQTANKTESCCQSSSGTEPTGNDCSTTSFVELLQMAGTTMLHGIYYQGNRNESSNMDRPTKSEDITSNLQRDQELRDFDLLQNSRLPENPKETELSPVDQSELSEESAAGASFGDTLAVSLEEVQKFSLENRTFTNNRKRPAEDQEAELDSKVQRQRNRESTNQIPIALGKTSTTDETRNSKAKAVESNLTTCNNLVETVDEMNPSTSKATRGRNGKEKTIEVDWDSLRKQAQANGKRVERTANTMDSVDWEAVRCADVGEIAQTIKERGMNNMLAERIKDFLNRLVRDHGSVDLEWLRDVPPDKAKEYLLSIRGLGLKSVECVRLLTLHHLAFPVDTNVGRIAVRLGWVPLQPLPESLQLHLLELYPVLESIQKYLWPRLCKLDQGTLYELHYQMITFGKVFCTKSKPNCNSCPMRGECRHFASAFASARLALPAPEEKSMISATENKAADRNQAENMDYLLLPRPEPNKHLEAWSQSTISEPIIEVPVTPEPIIEVPASPEPEQIQVPEIDIEDTFPEDADEIPTIDLNIEQLNQNVQNYVERNVELQEGERSNALVVLTPEAASIPMPKLKNISQLRTEHHVYELPDTHPLLKGLDSRQPDDPCSYLLAIWTPGETINSVQPPERRCSSQESGNLCNEETCFSCNSIREARSQTVRGTLLIPCRTAMRGSFPLNGTYFQVNEVFADHESSLNPIDIPRDWLWSLRRRTVYFGTSIPTIFKGLSDKEIQYCFWRGFVCVRGFDRKTRAPRPLIARLHFPASKLTRTR